MSFRFGSFEGQALFSGADSEAHRPATTQPANERPSAKHGSGFRLKMDGSWHSSGTGSMGVAGSDPVPVVGCVASGKLAAVGPRQGCFASAADARRRVGARSVLPHARLTPAAATRPHDRTLAASPSIPLVTSNRREETVGVSRDATPTNDAPQLSENRKFRRDAKPRGTEPGNAQRSGSGAVNLVQWTRRGQSVALRAIVGT